MTLTIVSAQKWFSMGLVALVLSSALFAFFTPSLAPVASAEEDLITADDLLPTQFSDNVGLGDADLRVTIAKIIKAALSFLGIVAVCIVLYGGVKWMTSGGGEDKVKDAQKIMIAGLIGFAIILSAWAITGFVVTQLTGAIQSE